MGQSLEKIKISCMSCTDSFPVQELDLNYSDPATFEKHRSALLPDEVIVFESPVHLHDNSHTQTSLFNINASKDSESSTSYIITHEKINFVCKAKESFQSEQTHPLDNFLNHNRSSRVLRNKSRSRNFSLVSLNLVDTVRRDIS